MQCIQAVNAALDGSEEDVYWRPHGGTVRSSRWISTDDAERRHPTSMSTASKCRRNPLGKLACQAVLGEVNLEDVWENRPSLALRRRFLD